MDWGNVILAVDLYKNNKYPVQCLRISDVPCLYISHAGHVVARGTHPTGRVGQQWQAGSRAREWQGTIEGESLSELGASAFSPGRGQKTGTFSPRSMSRWQKKARYHRRAHMDRPSKGWRRHQSGRAGRFHSGSSLSQLFLFGSPFPELGHKAVQESS